jgi:hypothetical protein
MGILLTGPLCDMDDDAGWAITPLMPDSSTECEEDTNKMMNSDDMESNFMSMQTYSCPRKDDMQKCLRVQTRAHTGRRISE